MCVGVSLCEEYVCDGGMCEVCVCGGGCMCEEFVCSGDQEKNLGASQLVIHLLYMLVTPACNPYMYVLQELINEPAVEKTHRRHEILVDLPSTSSLNTSPMILCRTT